MMYFLGNFSPRSKLGNDTSDNKTKGLPGADRFDLNKENAQKVPSILLGSRKMIGRVITKVPIVHNVDCYMRTMANLLVHYSQMFL